MYTGIRNAWSTTVSDLGETGIAHGVAWKNVNLLYQKQTFTKVDWKKKITVGLMLLLLEQSCISGNLETAVKFLRSHLCCLKS